MLKKRIFGRVRDISNVFSVFGNLNISFNWVDYLGGVKLYDLPEAPVPFETPFIMGILVKE